MYFSEELYNSEKYDYKYKINNGYLFDKFNVFNDFIKELYKIKENHNKNIWINIKYIYVFIRMDKIKIKHSLHPYG